MKAAVLEMSIVDDPMLALIIRFVTAHGDVDASNEEFIKLQLETLQNHVSQFPKEQQGQKAMEWIKTHAENYRHNWQKEVVSLQACDKRCEDCPILSYGENTVCVVHSRWLKLLKDYLAENITSESYVEEALQLLRQHKSELSIATRDCSGHSPLMPDYVIGS